MAGLTGKPEIKRLEERIHQLSQSTSGKDDYMLSEEKCSWWVAHLTEPEQSELVHIIRDLEENHSESRAGLLHRHGEILRLGETRAKAEPDALRETYRRNFLRAETLRHTPYSPSHYIQDKNELIDLNSWLWDHARFHPETDKLGPL
jgi:hypothetical protein